MADHHAVCILIGLTSTGRNNHAAAEFVFPFRLDTFADDGLVRAAIVQEPGEKDPSHHILDSGAPLDHLGQFAGILDHELVRPVPATIQVYAKAPEHLVQADSNSIEFWVDNTPPIVKNIAIQQIPAQPLPEEENEIYNTISFTLEDPKLYEVVSGLSSLNWNLKVLVDQSNIYATPLLDQDGFWITGFLPASEVTISEVQANSAKISFQVDGRLQGKVIEVHVNDKVGNLARYVVYPQGGGF